MEWVHLLQLIYFKKSFKILPRKRIKTILELSFTITQRFPKGLYTFDEASENPLPELINSALVLEKAGASFIIMPCHSAHVWFNEVKKAVSIPFYSMIENTVQTLLEQKNPAGKKILLLATHTTINSELYQNAFKNCSVNPVVPDTKEQQLVDNAIKNVKSGKINTNLYISKLNEILRKYQSKGISMVLGCCTEIPLLFPFLIDEIEKIDPTLMLANMAIRKVMVE